MIIKRISAPKTWPISRKKHKFITKPNPGKRLIESIPINLALKILGFAKTSREAKKLLYNNEILIDKKRVRDPKTPYGFMDVLDILKTNEHFRLLFNKKGKLMLLPIDEDESFIKICKIIGKTTQQNGIFQINLHDGRNILLKKDNYKIGDSLVITLPKQEIKEYLKLEIGAFIFFTGGKVVGSYGTVQKIKESEIIIKTKEGREIHTNKKNAFVIGREKPVIKLLK